MARAATSASYSAALAIRSVEGSLWGGDTNMGDMLEFLRDSMKRVNAGDLTGMEAMLTGQATALRKRWPRALCSDRQPMSTIV